MDSFSSNRWMTLPAICDLASRRQWVCWKRQKRRGKETKVPFQPNGKPASATGPHTWNEMPTCFTEVVGGKFDGLGYVLTADDGRVCVDLDHCFCEDGSLESWAAKIVGNLNSYTEHSPGGDGLHIWVIAHVSFSGRRHEGVEIYNSGRYMTVTAEPLEDSPGAILDRTAEIEKLMADFPDPAPKNHAPPTFEIDPAAEPPSLKFQSLMENEKRFSASWHHTRRDLSDQSLSSYDMSLATLAAYAEWTDQEIANLLIAHRRIAGNPEKALRSDYLTRTLQRARQATVVKLKDYEAAEVHRTGEIREVEVDEGLMELSTLLMVDVKRVVQRGLDPAYFALETDYGDIHIGGTEILLSAQKARARIISKSPYIQKMTAKQWERCVALVCQLREHEDLGEGQRAAEVESWIQSYFRDIPRGQPENTQTLAEMLGATSCSFIWENTVYLRIQDFGQYLFKALGVKIPTNVLTARIAEVGWKAHRFQYQDVQKQRQRCNTWVFAKNAGDGV